MLRPKTAASTLIWLGTAVTVPVHASYPHPLGSSVRRLSRRERGPGCWGTGGRACVADVGGRCNAPSAHRDPAAGAGNETQ
jgi:hypothetical protein